MITAEIDYSRGSQLLSGIREALVGKGMDASHVVEDEVKQLSRAITNFTPPLGPGGRSAGAQDAGRNAIKRENENLISEARPGFLSMVSEKWGIKDVTGYVESSSRTPLKYSFQNIDVTGQSLDSLQKTYRNRRGKVPLIRGTEGIWNSRILTLEGTRGPFIDKLMDRVGMWKATWAWSGSQLGSRFPKWISQHFGKIAGLAVADFQKLKDPINPSAIIGSRFPGGLARIQFVKDAARSRLRSLQRKLLLILSDYKTQSQTGQTIEPAARRRREEEIPVE